MASNRERALIGGNYNCCVDLKTALAMGVGDLALSRGHLAAVPRCRPEWAADRRRSLQLSRLLGLVGARWHGHALYMARLAERQDHSLGLYDAARRRSVDRSCPGIHHLETDSGLARLGDAVAPCA